MAMPGAGESPGGLIRLPPSFVRLGLQEGDANGVGDAHSKFDPTATGPSGRAIADHVVRLLSEYTGRNATKTRTKVSATTWSRWSSEICSPNANHIDPDIAIESFVLAPRQRALSR